MRCKQVDQVDMSLALTLKIRAQTREAERHLCIFASLLRYSLLSAFLLERDGHNTMEQQ